MNKVNTFHNPDSLQETIIETAKKILKYEGRSALNARHLAEKVGCSVGTLYNVFKNMEDLVFHINADTMDRLEEFLIQGIQEASSTKQLARSIGSAYLEYGRQNIHVWNLLFEYQLNKGEQLPYWYQKKVKAVFQIVEMALENILPEMNRRKLRRAARTLWAGLHGITLLELNGKLATTGAESPILLWDSFFQNYLMGIQLGAKEK